MTLPMPTGEAQIGLTQRVVHERHGHGTLRAVREDGSCAVAWADGVERQPVFVDELHEPLDDQDEARALAAIKFNEDVARKAREIQILEAARARVAAEKVADTDFADHFLTRSQLNTLPAPEPLIAKVLPRHSYAILRGRDHSYKSFVAVDWACSLATGKTWQGHPTTPVRVLYIAGEGAHGLAQRITAWETAWNRLVPDDRLTVRRTALNLHTPGPAFDHLLEYVETGRYGLVIVDTLRRVSGSADANSSDMGTVVDNLDRLKHATLDGTVLAVAHTDKGDHDTRGYSGIEDDADVVWAAKRDEDHLELNLTKMKDGPDGRTIHLQAQRTEESLILVGTTGIPTANTTVSQIKILDTLRELFPDGTSSTTLLRTTGLAESSFYRALKELREAGHVQKVGPAGRPLLVLTDQTLPPAEETPTEPVTDSHDLPDADTPLDLRNSHKSHDLPPVLPTTPITPTTLRSGSSESESETNTQENPA